MSFASLTAGPSHLPTWTHVRYLATGTLIALALLLLARQTAGALVVPLSPAASLACGFVLGLLTLLGEWHPTRGPGGGTHLPRIAAGLAAALLPTQSLVALCLKFAWVPLVAAAPWLRRGGVRPPAAINTKPSPKKAARVSQQLTRSVEVDGADVCRGTARADFTAGQRTASIHLAFCPPFATTPKLEAAATEASDAVIKIGQVLPYAARIDVKLSDPTPLPRDVVIAFTAASPSS